MSDSIRARWLLRLWTLRQLLPRDQQHQWSTEASTANQELLPAIPVPMLTYLHARGPCLWLRPSKRVKARGRSQVRHPSRAAQDGYAVAHPGKVDCERGARLRKDECFLLPHRRVCTEVRAVRRRTHLGDGPLRRARRDLNP